MSPLYKGNHMKHVFNLMQQIWTRQGPEGRQKVSLPYSGDEGYNSNPRYYVITLYHYFITLFVTLYPLLNLNLLTG